MHPIHLRSPLTAAPDITQYQIVETADGLEVTVALVRGACGEDAVRTVAATLRERLARQGVAAIPIRVRVVPRIACEQGAGKFKLIKAAVRGSRCA